MRVFVAQWIARLPTEQVVQGSNPCKDSCGEQPNFLLCKVLCGPSTHSSTMACCSNVCSLAHSSRMAWSQIFCTWVSELLFVFVGGMERGPKFSCYGSIGY